MTCNCILCQEKQSEQEATYYPALNDHPVSALLSKAQAIVAERQSQYGDYLVFARRASRVWSDELGIDIPPSKFLKLMEKL